LQLENHIDLVIPRGSNDLVRLIKQQSRGIPVLGHADGICHVFVDEHADAKMAEHIVIDSKCDYPAACNSMETLLVHNQHIQSGLLQHLCDKLHSQNVQLRSGPRLSRQLTFGPPPASSMRIEYSSLACSVELVEHLDQAIEHCNTYGSSHTDVIVTENGK
jgi:delta-1-pyrroline-5-carboxylate synthetase